MAGAKGWRRVEVGRWGRLDRRLFGNGGWSSEEFASGWTALFAGGKGKRKKRAAVDLGIGIETSARQRFQFTDLYNRNCHPDDRSMPLPFDRRRRQKLF